MAVTLIASSAVKVLVAELVVGVPAEQITGAHQARAVALAVVVGGFFPVLVALGALADMALLAAVVVLLEVQVEQEGPLAA